MDTILLGTWKVKNNIEIMLQQNVPISLVPAFFIDNTKDMKFSVYG